LINGNLYLLCETSNKTKSCALVEHLRERKLTLGELGFVKKEKGKEYFAYVSS